MPHPQSRPTRSCGHHAHSQAEAGEAWQNESVQDTLQNVEQTCVDVRERQQAAFLLCPCKHVASHAAPQLHDFDNMISPQVVEDQVVKKYDSLWQAVLAMYLSQV